MNLRQCNTPGLSASWAHLSSLGSMCQFDRALVTSGLRPIPDKRIGTSNVAIAKVVAPRSRNGWNFLR
jgi:hypothetical protein